MIDLHFIDIPVYRLSPDRHRIEEESFIQKSMYPGPPAQNELMRQMCERNPDRKSSIQERLRSAYGGSWNYNEIIGFIELYFDSNQILGEYWQVKAKRIQRTRRKEFHFLTWKLAPELDIPPEATNPEILNLLYEYLSRCKTELKDRHFDLRRLKTIGPFVDWRALLQSK